MATNAANQNASGIHQMLSERKQTFETKLAIVINCECVLQSPEANMASLRELMKLFEAKKIISVKEIRLALVASLCVVFKDILPAYRIRSLTEQEKTQQMKKETRKLQFFEENLLINYRKYTEVLRVILQSKEGPNLCKLLGKSLSQKSSKRQETYAKIDWNESDRTTALKAVCELLKAHPQFNLSDELIMAVLPFLNDKREQVYSIVLKTLQLIFSDDCDGKVSLEICRAIHAFAKKKSYNKDKLEKKHEKEMAETRATQSREDRKKLNTLILNEILFVYFKLLKTTRNSQLLTTVLEGVATYSSLINVIYVDSLLLILNRFIAQESTSLRDGLNCVNAALNVMNHPGSTSALETDPTRFYNHLYSLLGRMSGVCSPCDKIRPNTKLDSLSTAYARSSTPAAFAVAQYIHKNTITKPISSVPDSPNCTPDDEYSKGRVVLKDSEEMTDVMLSSLNMLLIRRRRDVSSNRVLAFVKRLAGAALAMSEPSCTGTILVQLIHLLRLFPRCEVLFDSETEVGGAYRPNVDDPEACLPASACLWELVVLERHPSLVVRELAKAALHWGRTIHTYGPTEAAIRRYNFNIGPRDLTLDHLIQLSPADCRLQLATICEEQSAEPVRVTPTTKKRFHQTYVPSDWFKSMLEQSGLSKEYGDVLHSKRPRIEKS
ncbi:nucleolar complex-associated protein [Opisthorchis viverrini]|uniref:NOC3-like protein n=1 Tax=Opisthorchis viverrini TaxID=6198 RepID=A0A1S8WJJ2_OPIVI|nr:nucleolar complex-associated protein [Opisthorchis viverrini]